MVTDDGGSESAVVAGLFEKLDEVEVDVVGTPAEAVTALGRRSWDCVLVDLGLPGGGGLEVLKRIRSRKRMPHTPVVVGRGRDLSERDEARLGRYADALTLVRPQTLDELVDAHGAVPAPVRRRRAGAAAAPTTEAAGGAGASRAGGS